MCGGGGGGGGGDGGNSGVSSGADPSGVGVDPTDGPGNGPDADVGTAHPTIPSFWSSLNAPAPALPTAPAAPTTPTIPFLGERVTARPGRDVYANDPYASLFKTGGASPLSVGSSTSQVSSSPVQNAFLSAWG